MITNIEVFSYLPLISYNANRNAFRLHVFEVNLGLDCAFIAYFSLFLYCLFQSWTHIAYSRVVPAYIAYSRVDFDGLA